MARPTDPERTLDPDDEVTDASETHATTGGAAAAGAVTGGVIGAAGGGPIGAAIGAVGGAIVGAASERMMHSEDESARPGATEAQQTPPQEPQPQETEAASS